MKFTKLQLFYLEMAALGLIGTEFVLFRFIQVNGFDFAGFMQGALVNHTAMSMLVELVVLSCAYLAWMWQEAGRLHMPRRWLYVLLTLLPSPSVSMPLFLFARSRQLQGQNANQRKPANAGLVSV